MAECSLACFFLSHCQASANQLMRIERAHPFVEKGGAYTEKNGAHHGLLLDDDDDDDDDDD
jgi:hypothetical protein